MAKECECNHPDCTELLDIGEDEYADVTSSDERGPGISKSVIVVGHESWSDELLVAGPQGRYLVVKNVRPAMDGATADLNLQNLSRTIREIEGRNDEQEG